MSSRASAKPGGQSGAQGGVRACVPGLKLGAAVDEKAPAQAWGHPERGWPQEALTLQSGWDLGGPAEAERRAGRSQRAGLQAGQPAGIMAQHCRLSVRGRGLGWGRGGLDSGRTPSPAGAVFPAPWTGGPAPEWRALRAPVALCACFHLPFKSLQCGAALPVSHGDS